MVSHCDFDVHFFNLLVRCVSSLEKYLFKFFVYFLIGLFLLLNCRMIFYILDGKWKVKLFSHVQLFATPWNIQFSSVQLLSRVQLFVNPWTAARQASLSITNFWRSLKPMSIELVMPSNHLILCRPLLLPSIFPRIRIFSNESALRLRWPKYWSFSFNISPSSEHPGLETKNTPLGWTGWISMQSKGLSRVFSNTTVQKHQFFSAQLSSQSNCHIHTWLLEKP